KLNTNDVISHIGEFVQQVVRAEQFSVFLNTGNALEATITQNWANNAPYTRNYGSGDPLYGAIVGQKRTLTVFNEDDERRLNKQGFVACPIINPDTRAVLGMLELDQCDFRDLNMTYLETLRMLCEWIGSAYANARRYEAAESESIINPSLQLLSR